MKNKLVELMSKAKTETVIKLLKKYLTDEDEQKQISLISARYYELQKDKRFGVLLSDDSRKEANDINKALIELINEIPYQLNLFSIMEKEFKNANRQIKFRNKAVNFFNISDKEDNDSDVKITFDSLLSEHMKINQGRYNIAVIGKTGVGKSTLVNYLFNKENVVETGVGKPITEKGFHKVNFEINSVPATLFDSWGLEVGKADLWMEELIRELKGRDIDKPASEWFHTVLYCVAASSARIEDFEIKIINHFINSKYNVVIVFTKSDLVEDKDIVQLKQTINNEIKNELVFCEVCSEEKILKSGKTEKFGAPELYTIINQGFWESITLRLPERCINIFIKIIESWERQQYSFIDRMTGNFNPDKVYNEIEYRSQILISSLESEKCMHVISKEVERTIELYENFSQMLDFHQLVKNRRFDFNVKKVATIDYRKSKGNNFFWSAILVGIPLLLNLPKKEYKRSLKNVATEFCTDLINDTFRLKPEIENVLNSMLNSIG